MGSGVAGLEGTLITYHLKRGSCPCFRCVSVLWTYVRLSAIYSRCADVPPRRSFFLHLSWGPFFYHSRLVDCVMEDVRDSGEFIVSMNRRNRSRILGGLCRTPADWCLPVMALLRKGLESCPPG
jgi:hypothetical protein